MLRRCEAIPEPLNQHLREETGQRVCVEMNLLRAEFANAPYQLSPARKGRWRGEEKEKQRETKPLVLVWDH